MAQAIRPRPSRRPGPSRRSDANPHRFITTVGRRTRPFSPRRGWKNFALVARPYCRRPKHAAVPGAAGVVGPGGRTCRNLLKGMNMNIMSRKHVATEEEDIREENEFSLLARREEQNSWRSAFKRWLLEDLPYIVMLLLAVVGVALREPVNYWLIITPIYAVVCIFAGWRHFDTAEAHRELVYVQLLNWLALVVAIFVLYNNAVQGVLNTNASSLAMMTLLALGTFTAGLQARVWRICALGALLFVAVPTVGWLDQSIMVLFAATVVVIAIGAATWWFGHRNDGTPTTPEHAESPVG